MKAGGIDLLDLLKENLLAPTKDRESEGYRWPHDHCRASRRLAHRIDGHARQLGRRSCGSIPLSGADRRGTELRQARKFAMSQPLGGNLLQRPRCWYFRAAEYHCLRKGGGHCFAISGENQYHAIFDNQSCAIVHPSTAATVLVALGASVELTNGAGATRNILLEDFLVSPDQDLQRENDLKPHEILTAILLPALPASLRMAHLKQGEKVSFDWPLADVAVALDFDGNGSCIRAAVILGAAAPVPHRAKAAENILTGKRVDEIVASEAARAALIGAIPLAKNTYKLPLFETLVRRAILKVAIQP